MDWCYLLSTHLPNPYSAVGALRSASTLLSDQDLNTKVIRLLQWLPYNSRSYYFSCWYFQIHLIVHRLQIYMCFSTSLQSLLMFQDFPYHSVHLIFKSAHKHMGISPLSTSCGEVQLPGGYIVWVVAEASYTCGFSLCFQPQQQPCSCRNWTWGNWVSLQWIVQKPIDHFAPSTFSLLISLPCLFHSHGFFCLSCVYWLSP